MSNNSSANPPVAAKRPHSVTHHGITVCDDYAWLRDPGYPEVTDPDVLAYLKAENAWFDSRMNSKPFVCRPCCCSGRLEKSCCGIGGQRGSL